MEPLRRQSLIEQATLAIEAGLRDGTWRGRLPGNRTMCKLLGISQPTLAAAIRPLVERGLLSSGGPRKRFGIPEARPGSSRASAGKRVLYLTDKQLHPSELLEKEILARLALHCGNWQFSHANIAFQDATKPHQSWDHVLSGGKPDSMVVPSGRPSLARWAHGHGIRTLFLGGDSGDLRFPSIAVSASGMLDQALAKLMDLGHHHIVLPLCRRQEEFKDRLRGVFARRLAMAGLAYSPLFHTPSHPETGPEVLRAVLEKTAMVRPPTALILLDWREAIAALGWLRDRHWAVPADMSLIVLSENPDMAWHQPEIARFPYPIGRLVSRIHRWLEGGPPYPGDREVLVARLVPGGSIATPLTSARATSRGRGR